MMLGLSSLNRKFLVNLCPSVYPFVFFFSLEPLVGQFQLILTQSINLSFFFKCFQNVNVLKLKAYKCGQIYLKALRALLDLTMP